MSRAGRALLGPLLATLAAGCATSTPPPTSATGTWEVLASAPVARLEMAVAAHDGRIWLVGGLSPLGEALTEVEIFDPASGQWSDGPSLPASVHHAALVSDGERLLLVGGYLGSAFNRPSELVLTLAESDDRWQEGPPLPVPLGAGAAAWDGERVVYAGGVGIDGVGADIYVLAGESWERIGAMVGPREHLAATSDGAGTVWLLGGRVGGLDSNLATVEVISGAEITQLESLPTARGGVAAFHDPLLGACLTGGEAPGGAFRTAECITAEGDVTTLPEMREAHHGHGAASLDGVAYVLLGGPEPGLSASATVESLALVR